MSKRDKILYVSLNLGCLGDCKNCPTKNMIGCDKVTVEKMIDWGSFERVLAKSKAKTVCLIGGGNPFYNSSGHKNIFFHIYNKVKATGKRLIVACGYEGTMDTGLLAYFEELHLFVPKNFKKDGLKICNTFYISKATQVFTYVETEEMTDSWLGEVRREVFANTRFLLTTQKERLRIKEYREKYKDPGFVGSMIFENCPVYSMADNRLYSHQQKRTPWRKILGLEN